jgi:hypothetical protein
MSFENMKSETFSLQLPFPQVFLLVVFIPTRTSHFFSGQKSGRRFLSLSLLALIRLLLLCLRKGIRSKHGMSLSVCIYKGRESIGIRNAL